MNRRLFVALALTACLGFFGTVQGDAPKEKQPQLKTVHVLNGQNYENAQLTPEAKSVLEGLQLPNATYELEDATLRVGVNLPNHLKGELLRIQVRSDCPNNSQFNVRSVPAVTRAWRERIQAATLVWTQHRHDDMLATLKVANVTPRGKGQNYDIQLNLTTELSAVRRE